MQRSIKTDIGYDNSGAFLKLEAHIPFSELKTFKLPNKCTGCPCGFMKYGCGRNSPFRGEDYDKRPETCKLEQITVKDILKMISEASQMNETFHEREEVKFCT